MPDPVIRSALVLAPAGEPAAALVAALHQAGVQAVHATQASLGLGLLCRRPPGTPLPGVVIILGPMSGLGAPALAKAVRGLPGLGGIPLIVTGPELPPLARGAMIAEHLDNAAICHLAATDPATWPTTASQAVNDEVLNPGPLQIAEQRSPGVTRDILAVVRDDLRNMQGELPRLLAASPLEALRRQAHRIKGTAGSIGAAELARVCAELEQAARAGDAAACQGLLASVQAAITRLLDHLASHPALAAP